MEEINKLENLTSFKTEITELQRDEESGRSKTGHFKEWQGVRFNSEELTEDDREIWEKTKNKSLTEEEFATYKAGVMKESVDKTTPRTMFLAFIANKATPIFAEKYFNSVRSGDPTK